MSYNPDLDRHVIEQHYIPYRLHPGSRYRTNCYYWSTYWGKWFKVEEVEYDFGHTPPKLIGVQVRWADGGYGYLSTDLSEEDFRIELDKNRIRDLNIINSGCSYSGAEIEYWFFLHPEEKRYQMLFRSYLKGKLRPETFYFLYVKRDKNRNKYAVVKQDNTREKFNRRKEMK